MNLRTWKDFLRGQFVARQELKLNGVQLEGEMLLIPLQFDVGAVANEYPDDLDESLRPVDEAFETMMKVHPQIHEIVQEAAKRKTP